ncbi:glucohydrolase [Spirochaetia bacterium]|nr:glucohydrolase [Spirochaetia bacterium]
MEQRNWWKECVIYQIYPKSFKDSNGDGIGDIRGIIGKLDYLAELGVGALWISPMYPSPGFDNGYDISDYEGIDPQFGTMADFERLLAGAHRRNIRIIMDLVVNHSSDEHPWFKESAASRTSAKRDYYIWRDGKNGGPPNNWGCIFGGSAWTLDERTGQYYLHLFSPHQPDLNWETVLLRQEIYRMMAAWLERGVDGFRMDVITLISKDQNFPDGPLKENGYGDSRPFTANGPRIHEFLREMRQTVLSKYDAFALGEASGVTLEEALRYASSDGAELDMVFQFEHMDLDGGETFKWNNRKIPIPELKQVLTKWQDGLEGKAWNSLYWCNHDQPRIVSRLGDEGPYREKSAAMLAICLHGMKGTPFVYQGEELGMTNMPFASLDQLRDVESIDAYNRYTMGSCFPRFSAEAMMAYIRAKSRDNARTPVQWDSSEGAGFSSGSRDAARDVGSAGSSAPTANAAPTPGGVRPWIDVNPNYTIINAAEQRGRPDSVWNYYRRLIELRKHYPVMVYGEYALLDAGHPQVWAYTRKLGTETLLVICNFSCGRITVKPPQQYCGEGEYRVLINNDPAGYPATESLGPFEGAVLYTAGSAPGV